MRFLVIAAVVATCAFVGCKKAVRQSAPVKQATSPKRKEAKKRSSTNVSPEVAERIRAAREAKAAGVSAPKDKAKDRRAEIAAEFAADSVRSAEKRKRAKAAKAAKIAKVKHTGDYHHEVGGTLFGNLVDSRGASVDISRITTKKYLLVYYSAHWCPPCRLFTPQLVKWYNKNHKDYEVVFVSADRSGQAMLNYMKEAKMPWLAAKFRTIAHSDMEQFRIGSGIPCLVLLDSKDKALSDGRGRTRDAYDKLKTLLNL